MKTSTIRGVMAGITWSYYKAADVENYTVTRAEGNQWFASGGIRNGDPFKLTQRPLVFVAPHKAGAWYWPILGIKVAEGRMTATLGEPITRAIAEVPYTGM